MFYYTVAVSLYSLCIRYVFVMYSLCIRYVFVTKKFRLGVKTSNCYIFHSIAPGVMLTEAFLVEFEPTRPFPLEKAKEAFKKAKMAPKRPEYSGIKGAKRTRFSATAEQPRGTTRR